MKYILTYLAIVFLLPAFASEKENYPKSVDAEFHEILIDTYAFNDYEVSTNLNSEFECSVTSSGTIETSNGSFEATLTVTGPCDASLAQKMREAIATLRAAFK